MKFKGVVHCLTDQGESVAWQFQDERSISENTTQFRCEKCSKFWDKTKHPDGPTPGGVRMTEYKMTEGGTMEQVSSEDISPCANGEHDFKPTPPTWFHFGGGTYLSDGDRLTIYDKDDPQRVLWSGTMRFGEPYDRWKTPDEERVPRADWVQWFFGQYPAELERVMRPR